MRMRPLQRTAPRIRPIRASTLALVTVEILASATSVVGCSDEQPLLPRAAETALASALDIRVTGCRTEPVRGAGSMIETANGQRYILTAAHVVAGGEAILARPARQPGDAANHAVATVLLAIDIGNDLALLGTDLTLPALPIVDLVSGDEGVLVVFRDEAATIEPFTILNPAIVNITDIYGEGKVGRVGYRVEADVEPGDSGAVLVGPNGAAGGVVYSKSQTSVGNAFATNTSTLEALASAAADADPVTGIDPGKCTN